MQTLPEAAAKDAQPPTPTTVGDRARPRHRAPRTRKLRTKERRIDFAEALGMAASALAVVGATAFVIWQLHPPTMLFTHTMDVGGDNASHVAAPYYLIHQLIPHGQISGWDPQWFGGFPLYVFYFPLPALFVGVLNTVFTYAVAFKLVTVAGSVLMPAAGYTFGRLAGFARPIPALMSVAIVAFLFNESYTIDGGNILSTLAGEFSYSLSVTFALFFLGVVAYGLRTGRLRWLAAVLFACTVLCHVVPAFYAAAAALLLAASHLEWRRLRFLAPTLLTGALLTGFWLIPFGFSLPYSSSMNYTRVSDISSSLFPSSYLWVELLALVGAIAAIALLDRYAIVLALLAGASAAAFAFLPSGEVYNARWLPFWFLSVALLAAYGFVELVRGIVQLAVAAADFFARAILLGARTVGNAVETITHRTGERPPRLRPGGVDAQASPVERAEARDRWLAPVTAVVGSLIALGAVAAPIGLLERFGYTPTTLGVLPSWVSTNYTGFQGQGGWSEFKGIVSMLDRVTRTHGCGRVEYEDSNADQSAFGSTIALMSLPLWTHGCVDTMVGVYYESSTTTPFYFLDQTELAPPGAASQPVVGLPYGSFDVADGVRHLQLMGVRYYLAATNLTELAAARDPSLRLLAKAPGVVPLGATAKNSPTWNLYLVRNSPLVAPLRYLPVVEGGLDKAQFLRLGIDWYQHEKYWPVPVVRAGPSSWRVAAAGTLVRPRDAVRIAHPATVTNVKTSPEGLSFDVNRTGVPVLVKIPYFPNWQAEGAEGPYEATPNLMVVVPTAHHVTLSYERTAVDWVGIGATAAGFVGVGILASHRVTFAPEEPAPEPQGVPPSGAWPAASGGDEGYEDGGDGEDDGDGTVESTDGVGDEVMLNGPDPDGGGGAAGTDTGAFESGGSENGPGDDHGEGGAA